MGLLQSFVAVICTVAFSLSPFFIPEGFGRDHSLPHVSPKMERPEFWVHKLQNPTRILLTPDQILRMNNENLERPGSYLCRVKGLKDEWTREEVLTLLKEDWQGFGETSEVQFGRDGRPLSQSFWKELKENIDEVAIKERNWPRFGLIVKRTNIRVFPTEEPSLHSPASVEFDRFQHSMISPGSLVSLFHLSRDQHWAYLQAPFIRGWVPIDAVGIAGDKKIAVDYEEAKERLMITGSFVTLFHDPSLQQEAFVAQMGSSFPIIHSPGKDEPSYIVKIPCRETDGRLTLQKGYVSKLKDVHPGFLPFTQANVAIQAFKMLRQPYGWGEMSGGRDCSRFIMDVFATFSIQMPRNSMLQAQVGIEPEQVEGKTIREKKRVLDRASPLVTTLRLPGHIMLYLGKHNGRYYVIHSIWGFQRKSRNGPVLQKVGGVVVSDLSLGEQGLNGSLLERITDLRVIRLPD
jgi:hypothetical protein